MTRNTSITTPSAAPCLKPTSDTAEEAGHFSGRTIVIVILVTHVGLLAWGAWCHSPTRDELAHLPAGISHWCFGTFDLYRVNPPLVRLVAAVPVLFSSVDIDWPGIAPDGRQSLEWECARRLAKSGGTRLFWWFTIARWACIPFSVLGAWICLRWAGALYGRTAGLIAMILWCFSPTVLANAQMITPDTGATALGVAASYVFWQWLREPSWRGSLISGLILGVTELTKFTWIVLFALWPFLWVALRAKMQGKRSWRIETSQVASMIGIAVIVVNLGYSFEGTGFRVSEFAFVSRALQGSSAVMLDSEMAVGNRFAQSCIATLPVPLPANYVMGIDRQMYEFQVGYWSYLRGEWRHGGWWYYYLYALLVKEPLGTWLVAAVAAGLGLCAHKYSAGWRDEFALILPPAVVLLLVSSQTGFNHHMRYILPIFPFGFIWMSKAARAFEFGQRTVAGVLLVILTWSVGSSLYYCPHNLSYFNELAGGPRRGYEHLRDSNSDWGQDLLLFQQWFEKHPEVKPIGLAYSLPKWLFDPVDIGMDYAPVPVGPSHASAQQSAADLPTVGPRPGWFAVFVNELRGMDNKYAYFERFEPINTVGYTVKIYYITVPDANRVRREMGLPEVDHVRRTGAKDEDSVPSERHRTSIQ